MRSVWSARKCLSRPLPLKVGCALTTTPGANPTDDRRGDSRRSSRSTRRDSSAATSIETDHKPILLARLDRPDQPISPDRQAWCWSLRWHWRRMSRSLLPKPSSLAILCAWRAPCDFGLHRTDWKPGSIRSSGYVNYRTEPRFSYSRHRDRARIIVLLLRRKSEALPNL
jgi:hypothetical protein